MIKSRLPRNPEQQALHQSGRYRLLSFMILFLVAVLATATLSHASSKKLSITAVTASKFQVPNSPANTLDDNLNTRWSAEGYGEWIQFELKDLSAVDKIKIAWYKGNERTADFEVAASLDGVNWNYFYYGTSSGTSLQLQSHTFTSTPARFIRIYGYGNSQNEWNSITEIQLFGSTIVTPPLATIVDVAASSEQPPNVAGNAIDGHLGTRWSAHGYDEWIHFELDAVRAVSDVRIAWFKGDKRNAYFDISVSQNGVNWTTVFYGESSGTTTQLQPYLFTAAPARYVRIIGYGNSDNEWNSITDVEIRGRKVNLERVAVTHASASTSQGSHQPANTLDGDLGTRWSGLGSEATIQFDLKDLVKVSQVSIAWFKGDERKASFDILVSQNGFNWTYVHYSDSSGTTTQLEPYPFKEVLARHVRIVGYGNTVNNWNSITEVEIYTMTD